jgi:hypothetical protein
VVLAEQVSHHPPVSASWVRCGPATVAGALEAVPRFWGNSVEVSFVGERRVALNGEGYVMGQPALCFRGIVGVGRQFTEWAGPCVIRCEVANGRWGSHSPAGRSFSLGP